MTEYTEAEILLQIQDVSKEYNGHLVLKKVCATIRGVKVVGEVRGQVVGFIGPSGIGKSTLLRIMAGLDEPTSGRVVLDAEDHAVRAGEVGMVAQDYPLFEHRTVMGNLMRAACKRYPKREARERVVAYLADFDLSAEAHHYPAQLSGGQRQRVAILQQVLCGSQTLLMDEPFSGLDPIAKKKTALLIRKIANLDDKNTIIVVTHDIAAAAAVADHLWAMGRDHDAEGKVIPGAYIVETYNLIDRDLARHQNMESSPVFSQFVQEIAEKFAQL